MKKSPDYIKKMLDEIKPELLKDKKLQISKQLYVEKLNEIFNEQVIDLTDSLESRISSTGSGNTISVSSANNELSKTKSNKTNKENEKIIFLNNEVLEQNINTIEEANNELQNFGNTDEKIIELKNEISQTKNQTIIDLIDEVDSIINLTDEVMEKVTIEKNEDNYNKFVNNNDIVREKKKQSQIFSNEQLELLNAKINDLDLNSSELTEKLDEIINQKNLFSEKFNDELDTKLNDALIRSEENLENKFNNVNDTYHQEFVKYEDETNKNFANLEDQIAQLNTQFEEKINDLKDYNLKIDNSFNGLNNKIDETLDNISSYKNEASEKIDQVNQKIQNIEPELINKIEEKQQNKTETEKLQDKFDQLSKIMDMQNMRMLQMYHSSELQHSHTILQKNMEKKNSTSEQKTLNPEIFSEELKKEVFSKIQKEMDKQFNLLKEQLSEYEIKSVLDKIGSTDLNKEFKKPVKKFTNLFDAKKYVKNSITKKSKDWIKVNDFAIDEIAKKLLDK